MVTTGGQQDSASGDIPVDLDTWYLAIVTFDGTTGTIRAGGYTATVSVPGNFTGAGSAYQQVGNDYGNGQQMLGIASEFVYDQGVVWTSGQIAALEAATTQEDWNSAVESLGGVTAWYHLDESSGTAAEDSSGNGYTGTYSGNYAQAQPGPFSYGGIFPMYSPALMTSPGAATPVALASGTPWQNTTGYDVILAIPIDFSATGTAEIQRGASSPGSTLGTITSAAGDNLVPEYYVPASWYITVTLASATFPADATAQPV